MKTLGRLSLVGLGFALSACAWLYAQQSGSGLPGGSNFSTQFKQSATAFGGAGPGTAGHVLTSNGAGMAPSFQAAGGTPGGADTQVQFNNAGAFGGDAGLTYSAAGDDLTVGDQMQSARINLTNELNLNGSAGTSGQVLTSAGDGALPTWEDSSGGVTQTTGTFEVSWPTACSTTPSQTWNYVLTGSVVTLAMEDAVNCTSDSTDFLSTAGDLPMALRPIRDVTFWAAAMNDGSAAAGCLRITTAGTFSVANRAADPQTLCTASAGTWTASGTKRLRNTADSGVPGTFTYTLN